MVKINFKPYHGQILYCLTSLMLQFSHQNEIDIALPDLPLYHYPYFFQSNLQLFDKLCSASKQSTSRHKEICDYVNTHGLKCWGYESSFGINCLNKTERVAVCADSSKGWTKTKDEQSDTFFNQGDFGYIAERAKELDTYCKPKMTFGSPLKLLGQSSSLECTRYFRFCRAKSIMINFKKLKTLKEPIKYRSDVLDDGQIGGWDCDIDDSKIRKESAHKSPLQSWYEELEHYDVYNNKPDCDTIITKPTYIMKLDATVNMYHHFCDFVNLYATLHLNRSFSSDINILIWDTYPYRSNFGIIWKAFTDNPILSLNPYSGKKVCFKDVVFPLLPRMVFGLYYNMPLVPGCRKSRLFQAFNEHILYKLNITQDFNADYDPSEIRITLISRTTKYRKILNEEELLTSLRAKSKHFKVQKVEFTHQMPFDQQLKISHNSDILIGMHGAGLTHCLFQPDWGVLFELYNCDDENCYKDLAALRGLKYITWSKRDKLYPQDEGNHPNLGAHQKFTNYRFDVNEFINNVMEGVKYVRKERTKYIKSMNSTESSISFKSQNHLEL
ncbi:EGF domain-specific O-linked N-acetylglucosamine transferase-like [Tetranychus urticae]|uniref:EGF domain-specific O-linked N-acetylglucosamine transferase n=1 Tax=Tetranychus urticae TaxID=32264 RepID=T1K2T0_TETUR|nr:EGF domain-specific O-linked N-acetylglucosamine transferase-like [Tetranychus urticae]